MDFGLSLINKWIIIHYCLIKMDKDEEISILLNKIKKGKTQQAKLSASESVEKKDEVNTNSTSTNKNIFNTNA